MSLKLLTIKEVCAEIKCSRAHVYTLIKTAGFPKPIPLSDRLRAWRADEVEAWKQARIEARDKLQAA